ncbi:MAG: helix-hairpin-helix domain-containing protein [Thermoplasmatota archaeon]
MSKELDEFMKITGIGEKRANAIKEAGINSLKELSEVDASELKKIGLNDYVIENINEFFKELQTTEIDESDEKKDNSSQVLGWAAEGFDVSKIEEEVSKSDDPKKVLEKYQDIIDYILEIREDVSDMNVAGHVDEAEELLNLTDDPVKIEEIDKRYEGLLINVRTRDLIYDLEQMDVPKLENEVNSLKEKLGDVKELEELDLLEVEVEDLKRSYRENFFVSEFVKDSGAEEEEQESVKVKEKVKTISKSMPIDDIFLFYRPKGMVLINWYKHKLSPERSVISARKLASQIRRFVKTKDTVDKNKIYELTTQEKDKFKISVGDYIVLAASHSGSFSKYGEKAIERSVRLIEKANSKELKGWKRKHGEPKKMKKVMKALMILSLKHRNDNGGV